LVISLCIVVCEVLRFTSKIAMVTCRDPRTSELNKLDADVIDLAGA